TLYHSGLHPENRMRNENLPPVEATQEKSSTDSYPSAERVATLTPRTDLPCHLQGVLPGLASGKSHLEGGFALRCFQRLSRPHLATQLCTWRHNWYTSGASVPVLSY